MEMSSPDHKSWSSVTRKFHAEGARAPGLALLSIGNTEKQSREATRGSELVNRADAVMYEQQTALEGHEGDPLCRCPVTGIRVVFQVHRSLSMIPGCTTIGWLAKVLPPANLDSRNPVSSAPKGLQ